MPRIKWADRHFDFNFPVDLFPEMIERLRGTPARLEDLFKLVPDAVLSQREMERWSIKENAGHLLDLECLVSQRLDQYLAGVPALHAADMTNRKTFEAFHNDAATESILREFRANRMALIERLDNLGPPDFSRVALHPRLNVPMRLVDMLFFQAEHDDYHLARISELLRLFRRLS